MNKTVGVLLLLAAFACNKEQNNKTNSLPQLESTIIVDEAVKEASLPLLPLEVKELSSVAPKAKSNERSSPSVYAISDSLSLIEHIEPYHLVPQWSFYDAYGNFIYSTQNKITYYSLGDSYSLVQESRDNYHHFYFISKYAFENLDKIGEIDFECGKALTVKQSDEWEAIKVECEKNGFYLLADFRMKNITLRSNWKRDPHYSWPRIEASKDLKSPFKPIREKTVLPIKDYGSKYMLANFKNYELVIKDQSRLKSYKVPLTDLQDEERTNYEVSYLLMGTSKNSDRRLVIKEEFGEILNPEINLISLIPFFEHPTTQNSQELICNFCEKAILEGKYLEDPVAYKNCVDLAYEKLRVENAITVTEDNNIIIQITTSSPDQKKFYKGAMILDSRLNVTQTFQMQDYTGSLLKFLSNSNIIYSTSKTTLSRYDQNGKRDSEVNFCERIPHCSSTQEKSLVSLKNGRFILTQSLLSNTDVKASELIYELLTR